MYDANGPDTEQLLQSAKAGDLRAREELFGRFRGRLRKMVSLRIDRRVAARIDASDVVQEAMVDACRRLGDYLDRPQRAFYPWLRQITWDRLVDLQRRHIGAEKRSVLREQACSRNLSDESVSELAQNLLHSTISPAQRVIRGEMFTRVRQLLEQLSPSDRELLLLRHLEQLSMAEIADVLEIAEPAVRTRHLRALRRLRQLLGDELKESTP